MTHYPSVISGETGISKSTVAAVIELLDADNTIPFIARYRKEKTGGLDEVQLHQVSDRLLQLRDLDKRRNTILKSIEEQGKLTDELKLKINQATTLVALEDLYLPFKPKRKTRASIARDKGLEPLAEKILNLELDEPEKFAGSFISKEKEVPDTEAALKGARDIIAEMINEDPDARQHIRKLFERSAQVRSRVIKGKEEEGKKFKDYFEWDELLKNVPSHRLLAIRRGEKEGVLSLNVQPADEEALAILEQKYVFKTNASTPLLTLSIKDSYKRLLKPAIETEIRMLSKQKADEEAITVFSENLKELLLASPLGEKNVLAVDPGFRTGCKVVCLNRAGDYLADEVIYPNPPRNNQQQAAETLIHLSKKFNIEAIAIGNGTASRETEAFIRSLKLPGVLVVVVNESGASIYSASPVAREEFPTLDLTVRGSISIGRRLMDPLAELVKIDPKSIGVGQYQHDVDQNALKKSLDNTVEYCVNRVGVNVNSASKELLTYVAGLGPSVAANIVKHRQENGLFQSRDELKAVKRFGDKLFTQAAGFLRIPNASNPLDSSAVHPERYRLVEKMASDAGCTVHELIRKSEVRKSIKLNQYVTDDAGLPTLKDIMEELQKPGRDPRKQFEAFQFMEGINEPEDLKIGMKLPGVVTNVTRFGAFVDVGVHQDGLVHISQLSDHFVNDPSQVVRVQQKVQVTVVELDLARKRIGLSMKSDAINENIKGRKRKPNREQSMEASLEMLKKKFNQ